MEKIKISIYGHYLNSVWLDNNDQYKEVTDPYCKYYFRIGHNGSTEQHIYLKSDSNFVFSRCVDWQPSEYTIDKTTTNITGDLNVSGIIIYNGGINIKSTIDSLDATVAHVADLAVAAYPIIEPDAHQDRYGDTAHQIAWKHAAADRAGASADQQP